jgi:hypothetical protein
LMGGRWECDGQLIGTFGGGAGRGHGFPRHSGHRAGEHLCSAPRREDEGELEMRINVEAEMKRYGGLKIEESEQVAAGRS